MAKHRACAELNTLLEFDCFHHSLIKNESLPEVLVVCVLGGHCPDARRGFHCHKLKSSRVQLSSQAEGTSELWFRHIIKLFERDTENSSTLLSLELQRNNTSSGFMTSRSSILGSY